MPWCSNPQAGGCWPDLTMTAGAGAWQVEAAGWGRQRTQVRLAAHASQGTCGGQLRSTMQPMLHAVAEHNALCCVRPSFVLNTDIFSLLLFHARLYSERDVMHVNTHGSLACMAGWLVFCSLFSIVMCKAAIGIIQQGCCFARCACCAQEPRRCAAAAASPVHASLCPPSFQCFTCAQMGSGSEAGSLPGLGVQRWRESSLPMPHASAAAAVLQPLLRRTPSLDHHRLLSRPHYPLFATMSCSQALSSPGTLESSRTPAVQRRA